MCLNPLEFSIHLNITRIKINLLLLGAALLEHVSPERIVSECCIIIDRKSNQGGE